jgi:hypothetical protein
MSQAKAIRVRAAAKKDARDANSMTVICCENDMSRANPVAVVATGWITSPRVHKEAIVTILPSYSREYEYPCPRLSHVRTPAGLYEQGDQMPN